jgi:hypothetical protein
VVAAATELLASRVSSVKTILSLAGIGSCGMLDALVGYDHARVADLVVTDSTCSFGASGGLDLIDVTVLLLLAGMAGF